MKTAMYITAIVVLKIISVLSEDTLNQSLLFGNMKETMNKLKLSSQTHTEETLN